MTTDVTARERPRNIVLHIGVSFDLLVTAPAGADEAQLRVISRRLRRDLCAWGVQVHGDDDPRVFSIEVHRSGFVRPMFAALQIAASELELAVFDPQEGSTLDVQGFARLIAAASDARPKSKRRGKNEIELITPPQRTHELFDAIERSLRLGPLLNFEYGDDDLVDAVEDGRVSEEELRALCVRMGLVPDSPERDCLVDVALKNLDERTIDTFLSERLGRTTFRLLLREPGREEQLADLRDIAARLGVELVGPG